MASQSIIILLVIQCLKPLAHLKIIENCNLDQIFKMWVIIFYKTMESIVILTNLVAKCLIKKTKNRKQPISNKQIK